MKNWTDYVEVIDIEPYPVVTITGRSIQGIKEGQDFSFPFPMLNITEGLKGKRVLMDIDYDAKWINHIHPGKTSIDAVSASMLKMLNKGRMKDLEKFWLDTTTVSPSVRRGITGTDEWLIYSGRRYHWEGVNKSISFRMNAVSFEGETPLSVLESVKLKQLRDVVDHPGITKKAIVTGGWNAAGWTHLNYDVEDVDMEKIFGDITRRGLEKKDHSD